MQGRQVRIPGGQAVQLVGTRQQALRQEGIADALRSRGMPPGKPARGPETGKRRGAKRSAVRRRAGRGQRGAAVSQRTVSSALRSGGKTG